MTPAAFSRRGFLTRAAAATLGLLGGSFVGGWSTRAWARPLQDLLAGRRSVIGQPRSVVPIGLDEALRRERRASLRPEARALIRELVSSGYRRVGEPTGADGVAGYLSEGGHTVSLGFAKSSSDEATVFVESRWWDQRREQWPCEDLMPEVFSREVIRGGSGAPSMLRYRYVDERGALVSREETIDPSSVADAPCTELLDCHTHPPGPCPLGCIGACVHCDYYANVCTGTPPDCPACSACVCNHWACELLCVIACEAICSSLTESWCCDLRSAVCCPPDYSQLPHNVMECVGLGPV